MSTSPVASVLALFQRLFPHRQFYLRSRGSVQFFELSPTFQMTVATLPQAKMLRATELLGTIVAPLIQKELV